VVHYEERIIAFLDILGFSKMIEQSVDSSMRFQQVYKALDFLKNIRNRIEEEYFSKSIDKQVTNFSDSIVFSYSTSNPAWFINDIIEIQTALTANGLLVRGGVTVGRLLHNEGVVFGPAMIEAYYLENRDAKYPRIIISDELYKLLESSTDEAFLSTRLQRDEDGFYFVNFLYPDPENDWDQTNKTHCFASMNERIMKEFKDYDEKSARCADDKEREQLENIRLKYVWLKAYVDQWIDRYFE